MIFEDPTRTRWNRLVKLFYVAAMIAALFSISVLVWYLSHTSPLDTREFQKETEFNRMKAQLRASIDPVEKRTMEEKDDPVEKTTGAISDIKNPLQNTDRNMEETKRIAPLFTGSSFLYVADIRSYKADPKEMEKRLSGLDAVFLNTLSLSPSSCTTQENMDWNIFEALQKKHVAVISTFSDNGEDFSRIIRNRSESSCLIDSLKWQVKNRSMPGIHIDIAKIRPEDRDYFTYWLSRLVRSFHDSGLSVITDIRMDNGAYDYTRIGTLSDMVNIVASEEAGDTVHPWPVMGNYWLEHALEATMKKIPKQKILLTFSLYGYDWNLRTGEKEKIDYAEAMKLAWKGLNVPKMDPHSQNSSFLYNSPLSDRHEVWFTDAVSVWNDSLILREKAIRWIGLRSIYKEDGTVWDFFSKKETGFDPMRLYSLPATENPTEHSSGRLFRISTLPKSGRRELTLSGKMIASSRYAKIPSSLGIEYLDTQKPMTVSLIFSGWPSKKDTPSVLDTLAAHGVKANFFPLYKRMQDEPILMQRVNNEGHILWIPLPEKFPSDLEKEKELTKAITGHAALLIESPVDNPETLMGEEALALKSASDIGYVFVRPSLDVRTLGWWSDQEMTEAIIARLDRRWGNTIVFYDDGDKKTNTTSLLDTIIPKLKAAWYALVTLDAHLNVSREAIMPTVPFKEQTLMFGRYTVGYFPDLSMKILMVVFFFATVLSIFRIVFLGVFVLRSREATKSYTKKSFEQPVTVLIPAYNEETVIERTVEWVLKCDYPDMEILVIDDGSKDETAAKVMKMMVKHSNVRLITKKNEGKSIALNLGFKEARCDYIITIDADTIILPRTIHHLMEPFSDPGVDAVCGNISVGNVKNILTAFQEVEYVTGQNYDRRAFDALNCITVVPGATGAWKKQKVLEIGGYSHDTLVEDADMTLTLLEAGGRIVYAPLAKSVTEAPETVSALFKQRFRWSYGTFQCFWKHRGTFGKWPLGSIALPNMILSQVVFNMFSPIGDAFLVYLLLTGKINALVVGYILFLLMDVIASGTAYVLDKKSFKHLWVILVQRFFYRQFMYIVTFKSLLAAIRWSHHGWNKLQRTGTVEVAEAA